MSQCKKFAPNIFHKTKCSNCFRQKEEHTAEALECNRASRSIARSGYLFVAPDWDFSVPLNRTKRWQRRWFVLYDDGELNYSVDEHPDTIPQGSVDMSQVLEVTGAEQVTGHPHSLALTGPDRVTFVKAASREDARWWAELLAVFPRRHKRNATFPGGRASPSLPQLGRSASPQPPRPRHLSCTGPSPRTNFETPPLKEERETPPKDEQQQAVTVSKSPSPATKKERWLPPATGGLPIENGTTTRNDYLISSGSPPTRDKLRCDDKVRARRDWRNERLRDIATALTDRSPESSLALPAESLLNLKKGWLWLKNGEGEFVRRWVVLCTPTLSIYHEQNETKCAENVYELGTVCGYGECAADTRYGFEIRLEGVVVPIVLGAVTAGIRSNWLQALARAVPLTTPTKSSPTTMLSSDDEYRTASEGGRRGSEDWGGESSPTLTRAALAKERSTTTTRLRPRLPRCQSRQSTLDSTSTDELDCTHVNGGGKVPDTAYERHDELQKQLDKALDDCRCLEEEIARLKKFQSDAVLLEKKSKEMMQTFERTEKELNQRNTQAELKFLKEQRQMQRRLADAETAARRYEDECRALADELASKQRQIDRLQDEIASLNIRLAASDRRRPSTNAAVVDSLTDLTDVDLDADIDAMGGDELKEYCLDVRGRFEKAVLEIRAMKRELRASHDEIDRLELRCLTLEGGIEKVQEASRAEIKLLVVRLEHLTAKLAAAEKQVRAKTKNEGKDKRRSLSLKGRESFSINKEVEDKVTELEAKILALERNRGRRRYRRERSSERNSPTDERPARRSRRKSLDSATSSEPMKLLMRLGTLETKLNGSNESLNVSTPDLSRIDEHRDDVLALARLKIDDCLGTFAKCRKTSTNERYVLLERHLNELKAVLTGKSAENPEMDVATNAANSVVKQLHQILADKLVGLAEKKRLLRENNKLDSRARIQLLAEKVAYENILIGRIKEALSTPANGDMVCERLLDKELRETRFLIESLKNKLNGIVEKTPPTCRTHIDYLTGVLAKCLMSTANGSVQLKHRTPTNSPRFDKLQAEQRKLDALLTAYKTTKLPQLAEILAGETLSLSAERNCRLRDLSDETINDFTKTTREIVNAELIRSEINHVLLRAAQMYQSNTDGDQAFFFTFFASERAGLELWSDSVADCLYEATTRNIDELTEAYRNSLNKLQRQNWRKRVENERNPRSPNVLLDEFADIIAHKALIDARLAVMSGKFTNYITESDLKTWTEDIKDRESLETEISPMLEAEFRAIYDRSCRDLNDSLHQRELREVADSFCNLLEEVDELRKALDLTPKSDDDLVTENWNDLCVQCRKLRNKLEEVRLAIVGKTSRTPIIRSASFKKFETDDQLRIGSGEYLTQVENLRAAYRCALASCKERHQESDIEQLRILCERVLVAMEQWHRRTIQELRETHAQELEMLKREKEQALAEETQATLAALDAMRKAHEAEVQREVAKFKQEFARQQRDDILDLSERLSVKCLEAAALEEQLGSATRQLTHAQQHILQLERNPQLSSLQN